MGCIISRVKSINKATFNPFPTDRAPVAKKVYCKGQHHSIFILTPDGGLYTNTEYGKKVAFAGDCTRGIMALRALGLITKKEMDAHFALEQAHRALFDYKNTVKSWMKMGASLGVLKPVDAFVPDNALPKAALRRFVVLQKALNAACEACDALNTTVIA